MPTRRPSHTAERRHAESRIRPNCWSTIQTTLHQEAITSRKARSMTNHVYRTSEIVGSSPDSIEAAIGIGIERASNSLRGLDWFEVTEIRGHIADGAVGHYQVTLKVGFRLDA